MEYNNNYYPTIFHACSEAGIKKTTFFMAMWKVLEGDKEAIEFDVKCQGKDFKIKVFR